VPSLPEQPASSSACYAEGVVERSPGSRSATWVNMARGDEEP